MIVIEKILTNSPKIKIANNVTRFSNSKESQKFDNNKLVQKLTYLSTTSSEEEQEEEEEWSPRKVILKLTKSLSY